MVTGMRSELVAIKAKGMTTLVTKLSWTFALIVVGVLICAAGWFYHWSEQYRALNRWNEKIIAKLESAKTQTPVEVSAEKWLFVVSWTQTAMPNVFYSPDYIVDQKKFETFQEELDAKLRNEIDLATIDWIWSNIRNLSKNGQTYAAGYQPVAPLGTAHLDNKEVGNSEPTPPKSE